MIAPMICPICERPRHEGGCDFAACRRRRACAKPPTWELRVGAHGVDVCEDHVVPLLGVFLESPKVLVPVTVPPIEELAATCGWPGAVE